MELRDIEIFLTLAEELHFGRTAERLYVSTARISQAVKKQERLVGTALFERTSRSVRLTEVGRQLQEDLRAVYRDLKESLERAQMAARGVTGRLRVLMLPFNVVDLQVYWKEFRRRNPQTELQLRLGLQDPFGMLRSGEFDVFVGSLPVEEADLTVGPTLFTDFPHIQASLRMECWEDEYRPLSFALVWRTDGENALIRALAATVRDLGPLAL